MMAHNGQENYDQPAKRIKKSNSTKPFALSQQLTTDMSSSSVPATRTKRLASVEVDSVVAKKAKSQCQFPVYPNDEEFNKFGKSSAGVVQSVCVVNFMCHSHFEMKFNPRINFISGCNGSGKSAIQTAMVIGLGGTASNTNRSSKIEGLIKHGCQNSSITIILSNNGWNAYKPVEYGKSIKIVRNISRSSSNNYKVYNHLGKLMASSKKEVENICSKFRIQPNNPVAILNQDMARNFLNSNNAEDKYTLFRKSILLDVAETALAQLLELISYHDNQLGSKRRAIEQISVELEKMTDTMQLVEELRLKKAKRFELENELAWTRVNHEQGEVDKITGDRDTLIGLKNNLLKELGEWQNEENGLLEKKKKLEEEIASIQANVLNKEEARQRLATDFHEMKKLYLDKCMEYSVLESNLKSRKEDYTTLKRSLDDVRRMDLEQRQKEEETGLKMSQLKQELDLNESKGHVLREEITRLQKNTEMYQEEMTKLRGSIDDMRRNIETCRRQIQSLGNNSDTLSMYEPWMSTLVRKIDEAVKSNRFSRPPIGPIGRYIKVKQEKWIYTIETTLGISFLTSFLVNNGEDRAVLHGIMDEIIPAGQKPTVHCTRFQNQKRDRDLPDLETSHYPYSNMWRALNTSDVVVHNFLMDFRNIQRILLVDEPKDCRRFVEDDRNIPRNCLRILDPAGDQYEKGYKVYANYAKNRRTRILRKSAADQLGSLQEEVSEKHKLITQANARLEKVQSECAQHRTQIQELSREFETLKTVIICGRTDMRELRNVIEMEMPSLQMTMDEIKEIEVEIRKLEEKRQALIEERSEAEKGMLKSKQLMQTDNRSDTFSQQTELETNKDKIARQLSALNRKISSTRMNLDEQEEEISQLNDKLKEVNGKLQIEVQMASQLTQDVVQTSRSTSEVQKQLKEYEKFIAQAKRKIGEESNKFQESYYNKHNVLEKRKKYFDELEAIQKDSKAMYTDREARMGTLRDTYAVVIMTQFQNVLKNRNYRGYLKFDHPDQKLDIMMTPIDKGDTLMNTSCLSGGEKSYSTAAFLLALWSNMNLPFYSMDEYDVFMDALNRKAITKLLVHFAKGKTDRQFIFLTPLDVSIVQIGEHVQVHKVNKIQT